MSSVQPLDFSGATIQFERIPDKVHRTHQRPPSLAVPADATPPVNQGRCGSCWAIAGVQVLRDRYNRVRAQHGQGPIGLLSFQLLLDCADNCVDYAGHRGCSLDCEGGFATTGYRFIQEVGTVAEAAHPARATSGRGEDHLDGVERNVGACPRSVEGPAYRCDGFYRVQLFHDTFGISNAHHAPAYKTPQQLQANADNIAEEVFLNGPVTTCFNLYSDFAPFWRLPDCGTRVYRLGWRTPELHVPVVGDTSWTAARPGPGGLVFKMSHTVAIVGYGTHPTEGDYWICRNSWGAPGNTHRRGYFWIARGINCSAVESDVSAPTVGVQTALAPPAAPLARARAIEEVPPPAAPASRTPALAWLAVVVLLVVLTLAFMAWGK